MFNAIKDWLINSMAWLEVLIYWICTIAGTVSIIYYTISKDRRGAQFSTLCLTVYATIEIVLGASR